MCMDVWICVKVQIYPWKYLDCVLVQILLRINERACKFIRLCMDVCKHRCFLFIYAFVYNACYISLL